MLFDFQFKTSERLIMRKLRGRVFQDLAACIALKRCLKFSCLGKRQADKVFISSVVVMDLLRGVEVV